MDLRKQGFRLGELRIEPRSGEVTGAGGIEQLGPRVMDVLVVLAGRAGKVVTREELHAAVWPDAVVTDDALTRCFYELRRQLSRAGGDESYREMIETLPKRGYRLTATVLAEAPAAPAISAESSSAPRRAWFFAAAGAVVVALAAGLAWWKPFGQPGDAADLPFIAVMPFLDLSPGEDQRFLADGVTEEVLNHLAQSRNLRVIARTSTFALRDKPLDIPQIGKRLGVDYVLEGSVRRSGDELRVTAQLIDVTDSSHLWSRTFDETLGNLFAIQDEIAAAVASALSVSLTGTTAAAAPPNAAAYEHYLQGRYFYNRRAAGDLGLMAKYLEEAVAIDPGFAQAWAGLAGAYHLLAFENPGAAAAWRAKRGVAALEAVELDPALPVAHLRLGQHYAQAGDRARAEAHFAKARELDPDDVLLLSMQAGHALSQGDPDQAVEYQSRAVTLDPLSAVQHNNLGSYLKAAGRYEEALVEMRIRDELNPAMDPEQDAEMVRILVALGRFDEASATIALMPEGPLRDFGLALLYQAPGRRAEADAALRRLTAEAPTTDELLLAEAHAQRGMNDMAFESLEVIRDASSDDAPNGVAREDVLRMLHGSPFLQRLESDPRWAALLSELAN
jgi:TolB-like protein/DNA-binding winged helix-turn-helix (wHTH) protein/tetratricopeptide (TPR) repeat protein